MFRSLNEDEGLENEGYIVDETGPEGEKNTAKRLSTIPGKEIQINRPHLDQQRLNNDYNFNQGTDDSGMRIFYYLFFDFVDHYDNLSLMISANI